MLDRQLELLRGVPDVRIVVGYMEHEVIDVALRLRPDITVVRNPEFRTTTTQHSYWLGARYLTAPCLYMDADIIFEPASFHAFLRHASGEAPIIAITRARTEQAVFVATGRAATGSTTTGGTATVTGFSRETVSVWEWANLAYLPPHLLEAHGGDVFSRLSTVLPLAARVINCCEFDTERDFADAEAFVARLALSLAAA